MPARLQAGVLTGVAALASILALAACGGSSKPKHPSGHASAFIAVSKCMRAHGVTNFPDPSGAGGGINISGTGINPRSPAFEAAQTTCFKLLPGGGPNSHKASAQQIAQATATAQCMRRHGVTGYPDPIISTGLPTGLNPANYSSIDAGGGIITAIPKAINPQSPAFQKAAAICNAGP
jgi:hypothetical protein